MGNRRSYSQENVTPIVLTPDEIKAITRKTQPAAQIRKLKEMGIRCYRTDDPDHPVTVVREWLAVPKNPATTTRTKPTIRSARPA